MNLAPCLTERITEAYETCQRSLETELPARIVRHLGEKGQPSSAFRLISQITADPNSLRQINKLRESISSDLGQNEVERTLLLLASLHALPQVADLPVSDRVKELLTDDFQFFANPPAAWIPRFRAGDVRFLGMARSATFQRFTAGQYHWQLSGFPRAWLSKVRKPWKVLAHLLGEMGGFSPFFELHLNDRRKNRAILSEKEANLSYYRVARSLEKQPNILGVMVGGWWYCDATAQVSPHLAWLPRTPRSGGALLADLGPAPADSGFLVGSDERRKLYEQKLYQPRLTCVLWPRKGLLEWANRHPEFDQ
jgi:hypothetical protein